MKPRSGTWQTRAFVLAFLVLTFFLWCPLGYSVYGEAPLLLGMPRWVVVAVILSAVLFVLEWIYLFHTGLAMRDEDTPDIVAQLQAVDPENTTPAQEAE